jgi:catabolite regulation protein CreA
LENYVKGKTLPSYTALSILAREAGVSTSQAVQIMIDEERRRRETKEVFTAGFRLLTNALNRLYAGFLPA